MAAAHRPARPRRRDRRVTNHVGDQRQRRLEPVARHAPGDAAGPFVRLGPMRMPIWAPRRSMDCHAAMHRLHRAGRTPVPPCRAHRRACRWGIAGSYRPCRRPGAVRPARVMPLRSVVRVTGGKAMAVLYGPGSGIRLRSISAGRGRRRRASASSPARNTGVASHVATTAGAHRVGTGRSDPVAWRIIKAGSPCDTSPDPSQLPTLAIFSIRVAIACRFPHDRLQSFGCRTARGIVAHRRHPAPLRRHPARQPGRRTPTEILSTLPSWLSATEAETPRRDLGIGDEGFTNGASWRPVIARAASCNSVSAWGSSLGIAQLRDRPGCAKAPYSTSRRVWLSGGVHCSGRLIGSPRRIPAVIARHLLTRGSRGRSSPTGPERHCLRRNACETSV